jgi:hypothetical protein
MRTPVLKRAPVPRERDACAIARASAVIDENFRKKDGWSIQPVERAKG